jgi:hypothetical protein
MEYAVTADRCHYRGMVTADKSTNLSQTAGGTLRSQPAEFTARPDHPPRLRAREKFDLPDRVLGQHEIEQVPQARLWRPQWLGRWSGQGLAPTPPHRLAPCHRQVGGQASGRWQKSG